MTYSRACFIASLALFAFACQNSSPQEATPAPSVEKAALPNEIEAKSPPEGHPLWPMRDLET